jgi:Tol biopolymer transport system component
MRTRHSAVFLFIAIGAVAAATLVAQDAGRAQFEAGVEAWDAGNYPDALRQFRTLLAGPAGDAYLQQVALITGEWHRTTELSAADRFSINLTATGAPRWSPDGRYAAFESVSGTRRSLHVFRIDAGGPRPLDPFEGFSLTFSYDGTRAAFLRTIEDDALRAARATIAPGNAVPAGRGAQTLAELEAARTAVVERNLASGVETIVSPPGGITRLTVHYSTDDQLFVTGAPVAGPSGPTQVYRVDAKSAPVPVTTGATPLRVVQALAGGRLLAAAGNAAFAIVEPATGGARTFDAISYSASARGDTIVFLTRVNNAFSVRVVAVAGGAPTEVKSSTVQLANPTLSPDGRRVVFQMMPREDWELYVVDTADKSERRITNEIQHDHTPRFLTNDRLLGIMGEARHRRSYVYDLASMRRSRLFHNNTIRTLSMEYAWSVSPDGSRLLVVADRDGDTISPERGVYLTDLTATVTRQEALDRLDRQLTAETDLRERGARMFAAVTPQVRSVVDRASVSRIYGYERDLVAFGSKHISQPGNALASEYIHKTLESFGYTPQYQYFEVPVGGGRGTVRTANVIATLPGATHPELEYVVSSHYDSVAAGPGADDDTSGSAALLEAARILRGHPMAATIKFLWFTGEESGLLGSAEYVRQAVARRDRIVGALNNDMVGFADDYRLDDTIRYSNPGLRDVQHAAAFLFTKLITYDARYYLSTDAASYYDAYGDIVSGIGSYPILGNPHYHQSHDTIDTVNFQLITEVAKATTASIMLMASSPSRVKDVTAVVKGGGAEVAWAPSPEKDVSAYLVRSWTNGQSRDMRVTAPRATIAGARTGDTVWVKAVNARGLEGWDWQRSTVR